MNNCTKKILFTDQYRNQVIQKIIFHTSVFFWLLFVICEVKSVSTHSNLENQVVAWVIAQSFLLKGYEQSDISFLKHNFEHWVPSLLGTNKI